MHKLIFFYSLNFIYMDSCCFLLDQTGKKEARRRELDVIDGYKRRRQWELECSLVVPHSTDMTWVWGVRSEVSETPCECRLSSGTSFKTSGGEKRFRVAPRIFGSLLRLVNFGRLFPAGFQSSRVLRSLEERPRVV